MFPVVLTRHYPKAAFWASRYRWLLAATATMAVWIVWLGDPASDDLLDTPEILTIHQAERAPNRQSGWQPTTLPDSWPDTGVATTEQWYRARFEAPMHASALWGLLIPAVDLNAEIYLNGSLLGVNGRMTEPVAQNWNRPLLFAIPDQLLRDGDNMLLLRVRGASLHAGRLDALRVGPHGLLQRAFDHLYLRQIELPRLLTIGLLLGALGVLFAYWHYPRRAASLWLASALIFGALALLRFHWQLVPLHSPHWDLLQEGLACGLFLSSASWALSGARRMSILAALVRLGWVVVSLGTAAALAVPEHLINGFAWLPAWCGALALASVGHRAWRRNHTALEWIPLAILLCIGVLFVDLVTAAAQGTRLSVHAALIAAPIGLSVAIAVSLIGLLRIQRRLSAGSDDPVAQERTRILSDVSEGVGNRLEDALELLAQGDQSTAELRRVLADALTDLSLLETAADERQRSLQALMTSLQVRLAPTVAAAGLESRWQITPCFADTAVDEATALQVLRIVQESLTNVLKHARASQIDVIGRRCEDSAAAVIEIRDNGCGFSHRCESGRGLANMRHRARACGLALEIQSQPQGTRVQLRLST